MKKAFTLIELLVVISIIAILASVVFINLNSARKRARDAKVKEDLAALSQALELVKVDRELRTASWGFLVDSSDNNDRNIAQWKDLEGNRVVLSLPTNPNSSGPQQGKYSLRIIDSSTYALLGNLSAANKYWCVYNGAGQEITASTLNAARDSCDR